MQNELAAAGFRVGRSQGATSDELRDKHRETGWAWEGDTHVEHHVHVKHVDGEPVTGRVPIQHFDAEAPGYVPEHMVLRDDSHEVTIWFVEGPARGGEVGEPTGYEDIDGQPIGPLVRIYVKDDDDELAHALLEAAPELVAELERREGETHDETAERHRLEAEERAAEDA